MQGEQGRQAFVAKVSWELGYGVVLQMEREAAGVRAVPWPRPSWDVEAGLETSSACCRGLALLHENPTLLILNAVPRHPQFPMHTCETLRHARAAACSPDVTVSRWSWEVGRVMRCYYYPLSNQTWNSFLADCPAFLCETLRFSCL